MYDAMFFVSLALGIGLWMTFGIGANDLANILSTAIGSKAISVRNALIIALFFETAGALFGGAAVSHTLRGGIIDISQFTHTPDLLIYSMLSVLLAGATWMTIASWLGMPVSVTHSIVGALVGVAAATLGVHAIHWQTVGYIAISWVLSPVLAGSFSWLMFVAIRRSILGADQPLQAAKRAMPAWLFFVGIILGMMMSLKALRHAGFELGATGSILAVLITALLITAGGWLAMLRIFRTAEHPHFSRFVYIEGLFSILMGLTACAMVFAHGSNDVAIAVGPISAVMSLIRSGEILSENSLTHWVTLGGCAGVILGLLVYGRKVIATVGSNITLLTPSRGFAATLSSAAMVVISTGTGIPVSATQTLVGGVLGVGLAGGIDALNLTVIRNIFFSWMITLPVAAGLATGYFYALRAMTG